MMKSITTRFTAGSKKNRDYSKIVAQSDRKPVLSLLKTAAKKANQDQKRLVKSVK